MEPGPVEPDLIVSARQIAVGGVRVARVIEPVGVGIPNTVGLAFSPNAGTLLLVTRMPGTPLGSVTDIQLIALAEDRVGTVQIAAGVSDPINMAFDNSTNRLLILQSLNDKLIEIRGRPDGSLDPKTLERFDARSFGVQNPRGMTVDPASGHLFISDASGPRIVRVEPDSRRGFENVAISEIVLVANGLSDLRGLALDPTTGHFHLMDPASKALHELTEAGRVAATHDLSKFGFENAHGMTFAPSGDTTDDPAEMSLYIAGSGFAESGQIAEVSFDQPAAALVSLQASVPASLVQTIDTWRFSPPSPDPAGITYVGHLEHLLISDSEVNEMQIFAGVNLFEMSLPGSLFDTYTTVSYSNEPTGITWNPANTHLFISDDQQKRVFEIDSGPDGIYDTADDVVTSFSTSAFGSNDPEGVAYDPARGSLFIADGRNSQVYRVSPGGNGVFDGVPAAGDDQVTSFDTEIHGLLDPEGIAYDSDFGHLYIVGNPSTLAFHVTTSGTLLRTIDISSANARKPAGWRTHRAVQVRTG